MSFREIRPTKTNLLNLQKRLNLAVRGQNFLEYKREQLIFQIRENYEDYILHRKRFLNNYRKILIYLNSIYKEMGKNAFKLISNMSQIQYSPSVSINYIKEFGTIVPKIKYEIIKKEKLPAYSFENTSHYLDDFIGLLITFFEDLILLAEKEALMLNFSSTFKKINRRINALKNIIIPNFRIEIKSIREILDELDRENFVRLKKTKDLIYKKH